jgi:hypothetical protein
LPSGPSECLQTRVISRVGRLATRAQDKPRVDTCAALFGAPVQPGCDPDTASGQARPAISETAVSARSTWLEHWRSTCHAAPCVRCRRSRWTDGRGKAAAQLHVARGWLERSCPDLQGAPWRALLDPDRHASLAGSHGAAAPGALGAGVPRSSVGRARASRSLGRDGAIPRSRRAGPRDRRDPAGAGERRRVARGPVVAGQRGAR